MTVDPGRLARMLEEFTDELSRVRYAVSGAYEAGAAAVSDLGREVSAAQATARQAANRADDLGRLVQQTVDAYGSTESRVAEAREDARHSDEYARHAERIASEERLRRDRVVGAVQAQVTRLEATAHTARPGPSRQRVEAQLAAARQRLARATRAAHQAREAAGDAALAKLSARRAAEASTAAEAALSHAMTDLAAARSAAEQMASAADQAIQVAVQATDRATWARSRLGEVGDEATAVRDLTRGGEDILLDQAERLRRVDSEGLG